MKYKQLLKHWAVFVLAIALVTLVFTIDRTATFPILGFYTIAFGAFIVIIKQKALQLNFLILGGILLRFILIFAFPNLSDDIYRFYWDGQCWLNGIHAFLLTPTEITGMPVYAKMNPEIFANLNSQNYYSIYPIWCQVIFTLSVWIGKSLIGATMVYKSILFLGELITIRYSLAILNKLKIARSHILLYALNPLIICEICGNGHPEGLMLAFLSVAIWYIINNNWIKSAVAYTLSMACKMHPAIFLPIWGIQIFQSKEKNEKQIFDKHKIVFLAFIGILTVVCWLPLAVQPKTLGSLDLYFRKFEFNGSIYYIFREIGFWLTGYNTISVNGTILGILTLLLCLGIVFFYRKEALPFKAMLLMYSTFLAFTTTLHPWYLAILLFINIFTNLWFPILWSFWIVLSYWHYQYQPFHENLLITLIEYTGLLVSILALRKFTNGGPITSQT